MESQPSNNRGSGMIWGGLLIILGVLALLGRFIEGLGALAWVIALGAAGLMVFAFYLTDRSQWWAMIPAYVLWAVAGLVFVASFHLLRGGWIATYILSAIGFPFLYVFTRDPDENWWALIPAYSMFAIAVMVGLIDARLLYNFGIPAYINLAIALPFFIVYFNNRKNWWALIPGGVTAAIGITFGLINFLAGGDIVAQYIVPAVFILAGAALLLRPGTRVKKPAQTYGPTADRAKAGPEADKAPRE